MAYILLVEDNQDYAELVMRTLRAAGYEVGHTAYGLESAAMSQQRRPDLILMDYDLPDIDGRNMILLIRKRLGDTGEKGEKGEKDGKDRNSAPPIVAMTGRNSEADIRVSKRLGCAAFISKPFLPEELLELVQQLVRTGEA